MNKKVRILYQMPSRAVFVLAVAFQATAAADVVLVSNLSQPANNPSPSFISSNVWDGALFITGDAPARFGSATLSLRGGFSGNFWTTLYSDNNGTPDVPLPGGRLAGPSTPGSGLATYHAETEIILSPNTQYWLVAATDESGTSGQSYGWYQTFSSNYYSSADWQLPNYGAYTTDAGTTWTSTADALIPRPYFFEISGAIVPEPSSLALLGAGGAWLILLSFHHRKQSESGRREDCPPAPHTTYHAGPQ